MIDVSDDYQKYMQDSGQRTKKLGGYQPGVDNAPTLPKEALKGIAALFAALEGGKKPKPPKNPGGFNG